MAITTLTSLSMWSITMLMSRLMTFWACLTYGQVWLTSIAPFRCPTCKSTDVTEAR